METYVKIAAIEGYEKLADIINGYTLGNRSIRDNGQCCYIDPEAGCMCIIGSMLTKDALVEWHNKEVESGEFAIGTAGTILGYLAEKDAKAVRLNWLHSCLRKEFPILSFAALEGLQSLHDTATHWTEKGLSTEGFGYLENLIPDAFTVVETHNV